MSDDIVIRLREAHRTADEVASVFLTAEAANEIERLRADIKMLKDEKAYWRLMGRETGGF